MTISLFPFRQVSDAALLAQVRSLATAERQATAQLIAALAELDTRRLYLGEGCSSLFSYCTHVLHLSEHAAYGRIEAARAARRFPVILDLLTDGSINLTIVGLLASHLTAENHLSLLEQARRKSKRDVELLLASLRPRPDVPSSVRKLPVPKTTDVPITRSDDLLSSPSSSGDERHRLESDDSTQRAAAVQERALPTGPESVGTPRKERSVVAPLAPERYKIQFTASRDTYDKLRQVQDLLRHTIPNGDAAAIFDRALTLLLEDLSRKKLAWTTRPQPARKSRSRSRRLPAAVKREVWARDGGQCAFVGAPGRCTETRFLEFHHVVPYAAGGQTVSDNLELRCKAHNLYEAELYFSPRPPSVVREVGPTVCYRLSTRSGPS